MVTTPHVGESSRARAWESALQSGGDQAFSSVLADYKKFRSKNVFEAARSLTNITGLSRLAWESFVRFATDEGFYHFADFADFIGSTRFSLNRFYTPVRISSGVFGVTTRYVNPTVCTATYPPLLDSGLHLLEGFRDFPYAIADREIPFLVAIGTSILAGKTALYDAERIVKGRDGDTGAMIKFTFSPVEGGDGYRLPTISELAGIDKALGMKPLETFQWVSPFGAHSLSFTEAYPLDESRGMYTKDESEVVEEEELPPICEWALTSAHGTRAVPVRIENGMVRMHPELMDRPHVFRLVRKLRS